MDAKTRFYKSSFLVSLLLFFLCLENLYAGGVFSGLRKVYVVNTNHFELIFPKESEDTAKYIAENVDGLYEKAKVEAGLQNDFVMPIIISPDSSILNVKYTNRPYNRIVIFDAVPTGEQIEREASRGNDDILLSLLYKEIFLAVSGSVRSPFNEFIYKYVLGDPYQPATFINLPFSFSQAYSDLATSTAQDTYFQQLLIQAKLEDKFPTWLQAAAVRDIHPGNDLCHAAGTGFAAYLMNSRGLAKYAEFWNECGKLHPYFLNGIFHKVYGEWLSAVWKEFEASIPLPPDQSRMHELEALSHEVSENDRQGAFENILYTNYGIVWYDSIRHEVDIYDFNSIFKIRQLLFIADNITKLSLSPGGRYVSASFTRGTTRPEFKEDVTCIFDLRDRKFLPQKLPLRDACILSGRGGEFKIAGIYVAGKNSDKTPELRVYSFKPENKECKITYQKFFEKTQYISSVCAAGKENIAYLLSDKSGKRFVIENVEKNNQLEQAEQTDKTNQTVCEWTLLDNSGNQIVPVSLQLVSPDLITFSYYPQEDGALVRSGYIKLTDSNDVLQPESIYVQQNDVSGGVYYPVIAENKIYYCAKKFSHNELRWLPFEAVNFSKGEVLECEKAVPNERSVGNDSDLNLKRYNPFKYMTDISFMPMMAIRDITLDNGAIYWPSLGLYLTADSDPLRNTEITLSGGLDFLVLSFEKEWNTVPKETQKRFSEIVGKRKKYNFAAYIENSSTPVDISGGALFKFNKGGDYDFKAVAKTSWNIPVGTILRDMEFSIASIYSSSTDYYDENKIEFHPQLPGWTPLKDAYELFEVSATVKYSNSHQYGISQYERRGLTLGWRVYSLWDLYEIELLNKYRDETRKQIKDGENTELTEVQLENLYKESLMNISQLNVGFSALIEIPRLTPLEIYNGWVLSVPSTIELDFMNKTGTAFEANFESLIIGNEIQNGLPFLYLFFSRAGLWGGYNLRLDYDTTKVQLPDFRRKNYLADVFSQTHFTDSVFLTLNTDFIIPTGKLSEIQFNLNLRGEYFIKTNGFKISLNVNALF